MNLPERGIVFPFREFGKYAMAERPDIRMVDPAGFEPATSAV